MNVVDNVNIKLITQVIPMVQTHDGRFRWANFLK